MYDSSILNGFEQVVAGTAAGYGTSYKPGIESQETVSCGTEMVAVCMPDPKDGVLVTNTNFNWGVNKNCKDPERACQLLDLLYYDVDLNNLLSWGIEGVHYDVMEDGHITTAASLEGGESGYNPAQGWIFGNQFITYVWEGDDLDLYDQLKEFNDTARKSKAFGFTFDNANVVTEIAAVQSVYDQYSMGLECGLVDPNEVLPTMLEEMEAAGIQKIIDEKQAQLDAWAESQS